VIDWSWFTLAQGSTQFKEEADFFDRDVLARTDGAGGQNRTGYARLFRAALYQ
jgi:hypothetical protein